MRANTVEARLSTVWLLLLRFPPSLKRDNLNNTIREGNAIAYRLMFGMLCLII